MSSEAAALGPVARFQRRMLTFLGFKSITHRRIGDTELTAEEAQLLGRIAAGTTRKYTFPLRIERMFQSYVRENSRAARLSLSALTFVIYLSIPLWISVLGIPPESVRLMTWFSLGVIAPLFAVVTYVQARYLDTNLAEGVLIAALLFEAVLVEIIRHKSEQWGYPVEPSISVLIPVSMIAMARLRVSQNFLFIALYFQMLASEPFWWIDNTLVDYASSWAMNLVLLSLLIVGSVLSKVPLQSPRKIRQRGIYNVSIAMLYLIVLVYEALLWPDEMRTRGPTAWLMEILLLTIIMLAAIWSKLSSRRQWAANVLLQLLAYRDSLTGLQNRRAFEDHYDRVIRALARSQKKQLVLAVLDLDHFKKLNDDYGHDYGDGALAEVALLLAEFARRSLDMSARLGGEEFALLLYDCDAENARPRLMELVQAIEAMQIENRSTERGVLTCSIGAVVVEPNEPFGDAYRSADELLYQVKNAGRNNFALAD